MARTESSLRRQGQLVWGAQLAALLVSAGVAVPSNTDGPATVLSGLFFLVMAFSFATVGLLVIRSQPHNRFAWFMLLVTGTAIALPTLLDAYVTQGMVNVPGSLPGVDVVAALNRASWVWSIGTIGIFLVLLFPDGRVPTPRWHWLVRVGVTDLVTIGVTAALIPGTIEDGPAKGTANVLGLDGLKTQVEVVFVSAIVLLPVCLVAAAVAMVGRFRRSHGTERLQLKWFASAAALVAASYMTAMIAQFFKPEPFAGPDPPWLLILQNVATVSFVALPAAIGVAVLRHRLYDIDVVIKRTVVYGSLTASLALVYLVVVLTLRSLTGTVAGDSDLAVASSTLVVAALFRPLRRRIQRTVDRRFFRRGYDAARTVDSFGERLKQEVDLDAVTADLRGVVGETLQPAHLSLWLRGAS